jgi:hypothetical protein
MIRKFAASFTIVALAACAGGDSRSADTTSSVAAAPNVVTIMAQDFSFQIPDTIPAGVTTFQLMNHGPNIHHAQLMKFNEGKRLSDFMDAMKAGGPPPAWVVDMGGPNPPAVGATTNSTQTLEPGNYAVVCFVDTPDKVPHITKGMSKEFVVVPSTAPVAAEPTADVTMQLVDYAFNLSTPLTPGTHTIRIENAGPQSHEVFIARLDSGKTADDLMKWAQTYQGPPPVTPLGGIAAIHVNGRAFVTAEFTPGDYVLVCFVTDSKDGKPHVAHGMMQTVKVG